MDVIDDCERRLRGIRERRSALELERSILASAVVSFLKGCITEEALRRFSEAERRADEAYASALEKGSRPHVDGPAAAGERP